MDSETKPTQELYAALAKAQADLKAVPKDETYDGGNQKWNYASSESLMQAATVAMGAHDLALICTNWELQGKTVTAHYLLTHAGGGSMALGPYQITAHENRGKPMDKAVSTALTYLQGYGIRGIFNLPRVQPGDERDAQHDEEIQAWANEKNKQAKKAEKEYAELWTKSTPFFEAAGVSRPKNAEGIEVFKKWIAWAAHPGDPFPPKDEPGDRLISMSHAKKALGVWSKSDDADKEHECREFAADLGYDTGTEPGKSPTEQAAEDAFEASLEKGEG